MSTLFLIPLYLGLALQINAAPSNSRNLAKLSSRNVSAAYSLPSTDANTTERANAIQVKRDTFVYGPSLGANVSFWPAGSLGNLTVQTDFAELYTASEPSAEAVQVDEAAVITTLTEAGGFKTLSDFELLYKDQWKTSIPDGLDKGVLSNYTDDLMFSMERLTVNPYTVKRLTAADSLPFMVDDIITSNVTGTTLELLLKSGSLFYADHRYQVDLQSITGRYAAACDAYFYIHPVSGDFLPLAVRTNVGSNLVYTPADSANDWLLAKMMFNLNDFFHSQFYHFSGTHNVVEIVYEAAFRTLSEDHPVMAILERLTPQLFSYRVAALAQLLNPGGLVDQVFAYSGAAGTKLTGDLYHEGSGNFQANYLYTDLKTRGLINSTFGPKIKHFPFLEDASAIHASIQKFVTSFVDSFYTDSSAFEQDTELQAWIAEAVPAQIMDFPTKADRNTLIDILTHVAFLGSAEHQTLNTNDISEASGSLPFHPFALYQPIPTEKGVNDIVPFLPNITQSVGQIGLTAVFARATFIDSSVSLTQMFNDSVMLARMNTQTTEAAATFQNEMLAFSGVVSSRTFDGDRLCQGMPFIWKALDPQRAPYYLTI